MGKGKGSRGRRRKVRKNRQVVQSSAPPRVGLCRELADVLPPQVLANVDQLYEQACEGYGRDPSVPGFITMDLCTSEKRIHLEDSDHTTQCPHNVSLVIVRMPRGAQVDYWLPRIAVMEALWPDLPRCGDYVDLHAAMQGAVEHLEGVLTRADVHVIGRTGVVHRSPPGTTTLDPVPTGPVGEE